MSEEQLQIRTERLLLRPFVREDFAAVHRYGCDPEVVRHMLWGPNTEQETRDFIERTIKDLEPKPRLNFQLAMVLPQSDELIGGCGLFVKDAAHKQAEVGYCIAKEHWRRGYATEVAKAMIRLGFETLKLHRIYATADVNNTGSWRAMVKAGMQREGLLRENVMMKGTWRNTYLYSILESEWKP